MTEIKLILWGKQQSPFVLFSLCFETDTSSEPVINQKITKAIILLQEGQEVACQKLCYKPKESYWHLKAAILYAFIYFCNLDFKMFQ